MVAHRLEATHGATVSSSTTECVCVCVCVCVSCFLTIAIGFSVRLLLGCVCDTCMYGIE